MKHLVERAITTIMRLPGLSNRMAGRVLVLAYHNVTPPGLPSVGERSAHIQWDHFVEHLDVIGRVADVVALDSLLECTGTQSRRPRVVLTFDDAYAGAVEYGVPEVSRRRMPATVFVAPGFIGGHAFWWDCLADPSTGILDSSIREHVLGSLSGRTDLAREWARQCGKPWNSVADYACASREGALRRCATLPGVTIGGHTWTHPNMLNTDPTIIEDELNRSRAWEHSFASSSIPAFAFPYGHCSQEAEALVRAAGYRLTALVSGGWCTPVFDARFPLPRLNVPAGLSARGLEIRLRGMLV